MTRFLILLLLLVFIATTDTVAQSGGKKKKDAQKSWDSPTRDPDALFKGGETPTAKKAQNKKSKRNAPTADPAIVQYEQLKKDNAKKYAKMAKEMQKPQYSDPSYFGHKKKPKKRPLKKRKFCQECGIVH